MRTPRKSALLAAAAAVALALAGCGSQAVSSPPTSTASDVSVTATDPATDGAAGTGGSTGTNVSTGSTVIDQALAGLKSAHTVDPVGEDAAAVVTLDGSGADSDSDAVTSTDGTVSITAGGTYRLSGDLAGQVVVDAGEEKVVLILDGVTIESSSAPALAVSSADEVTIVLAEGSTNTLSDGTGYSTEGDNAPNAALYSADDLSITGTGSLTVVGNTNDGITSKDGLVIESGTITVTALDDGVRGKDYLHITGGTLAVTAGGHALKSDNTDDATVGWVAVLGGTQALDAGEDGINAQTILFGTSAVTISAGDDAAHADAALVVDGSTLTVSESYEGLEALQMTIASGTLEVHAMDDAINIAGGDGSQAMGRPGDMFAALEGAWVEITGGEITLWAEGDGFDSNGSATMSGGTLTVYGPTNSGNGAIDVNGTFEITGGTLIAGGASGMAEVPEASSSQGWVSVTFSGTVPAGTTLELADGSGTILASYTSDKTLSSVVYSTAGITPGTEYTVIADGSEIGTVTAGVHSGGFGGGPGGGAAGGQGGAPGR